MGDQALAKKVAERAYQLFLKRGGKHGYHQQDWLQAEKDIRGTDKSSAKPAKAADKAATPKKAKSAKKSKK